jgi:hypothetical protein
LIFVFREALGQVSQFWIVATKLWDWASEKLLKEELAVLPIILELVRLFRNIVVAVAENQNQALYVLSIKVHNKGHC